MRPVTLDQKCNLTVTLIRNRHLRVTRQALGQAGCDMCQRMFIGHGSVSFRVAAWDRPSNPCFGDSRSTGSSPTGPLGRERVDPSFSSGERTTDRATWPAFSSNAHCPRGCSFGVDRSSGRTVPRPAACRMPTRPGAPRRARCGVPS